MFNDNKTFINVNEEIRREIMKRYSFFLALAAMLVLSFGLANGASVSLSNAETGYSGADTVATGKQIVWTFNMTNSSGSTVDAILNGFVIYSSPESSVTWALPFLDTLDLAALTGTGWDDRWDLVRQAIALRDHRVLRIFLPMLSRRMRPLRSVATSSP